MKLHRQQAQGFTLWAEPWADTGNGVLKTLLLGKNTQLPDIYKSGRISADPHRGRLTIEIEVPPALFHAALRVAEDLMLDVRTETASRWKDNPSIPDKKIRWHPRAKKNS